MSSSRDRASRTVKFTQTEADQTLLRAVEQALLPNQSFSELCKQALQHFLLSAKAAPQVTQLDVPSCPFGRLEQQMLQLENRLKRLENGATFSENSSPETPTIEPLADEANHHELDPLLSRLAPLLEDF
jgi:hypothetical protein